MANVCDRSNSTADDCYFLEIQKSCIDTERIPLHISCVDTERMTKSCMDTERIPLHQSCVDTERIPLHKSCPDTEKIPLHKSCTDTERSPTFRRCRCDPPRRPKKNPSTFTHENFPTPSRQYGGDAQGRNSPNTRSKSVPVKTERATQMQPMVVECVSTRVEQTQTQTRAKSAVVDRKSKASNTQSSPRRIDRIVEEKNSCDCPEPPKQQQQQQQQQKQQKQQKQQQQQQDKGQQNSEDLKYSEFLLNITTDIIKNNLCTCKEFDVIFQSHIAANRCRLDERRMLCEIEALKKILSASPDTKTDDNICDSDDVVFDETDELPCFETVEKTKKKKKTVNKQPSGIKIDSDKGVIFGKIAYKLCIDPNCCDEPHILIDGPLLLPKSIVEKKITPIILQNSQPSSLQAKL